MEQQHLETKGKKVVESMNTSFINIEKIIRR